MKKVTILISLFVMSVGIAQASISIYGSPTGYQSNDKDWMSNTTDDIDGNGLGTDGYIFFGDFVAESANVTYGGPGTEISAISPANQVTYSYPSYISTATMGANCNSKIGNFGHYELIDNPLVGDGTDGPCGNIIILQNTAGEALNFSVSGLPAGQVVRLGVVTVLNDGETNQPQRWDIPTITLTDGTNTASVTDLPDLSNYFDTTGPGWVFFDIDSDGDYTLLLPPDAAGTDPDHTGLGGVTFDTKYPVAAHNPIPGNNMPDVDPAQVLQWMTGIDPGTGLTNAAITQHFVYMTKSETDPNLYLAATLPVGTTSYDPSGEFELARDGSYSWRVDESVGYPAGDPNNITGPTWSFTTLPSIPVIDLQPQRALVDDGDEFVLSVEATNPFTSDSTGLNYQWYRDGAPVADGTMISGAIISGAQTNTLTVTSAHVDEEGDYVCRVEVASNGAILDSDIASIRIKKNMFYDALDGDLADPNVVEGKIGQAYDFNGVDEALNYGNIEITDSWQFSAAFWAQPRDVSRNWSGFLCKGDHASDPQQKNFWIGQHSTDGNVRYAITPDLGTTETTLDTTGVLTNDEWVYIVCTYDGNFQRMYVDGLLVNTSADRDVDMASGDSDFLIGMVTAAETLTTRYFDGLIDDVSLYNYALSATEVADAYVAVEGSVCLENPAYDLNGDCKTDLADVAMFAATWLDCNLYPTCVTELPAE